jgi:3-dehydroquinate dehydratase-2
MTQNKLRILVVHGPNLNLFGRREQNLYDSVTLDDINNRLVEIGNELDADLECFQSNVEGHLIDTIQKCMDGSFQGILINPAAYGHTSIALRDALKAVALPFVEVHQSNVYAREEFRHRTFLSDFAAGVVVGFGANSYYLGLRGLIEAINRKNSAR